MAESRFVAVVLAFAGGGTGALLAQFIGVATWLDAKLFIVGGVVVGLLISALIGWLPKGK